jgi:phage/plasmid-associated DNA primase
MSLYEEDPTPFLPDTVEYWLNKPMPFKAKVLRAWLRACLVGAYWLQRYMELTGKGSAGKSTYMALCCAIVGDTNIASTSLRALETNRFETATIKDKRLAVMVDSERYCGPAAMLKAMIGGDPLPYEEKHKQKTRSFIFTGLVLLVANETIAFEDYTSGITRRRIAVNIEKLVTEAEKRAWTKVYGHDTRLGRLSIL